MATAVQALARIRKEYKEVQFAKDSGVSAELVNNDLAHWKGVIAGPQGTPYQGGTFYVDIDIPKNYPFVPPKMRFETKVWHPNISSANGAICLDILKNEWSPALTLRTALLSLQALLSCPNADDPQDAVVAGQYKADRKLYEKTAKFWTDNYALPKKVGNSSAKVQQLVGMGFSVALAEAALAKCKGDENAALEWMLTQPAPAPSAAAAATAAPASPTNANAKPATGTAAAANSNKNNAASSAVAAAPAKPTATRAPSIGAKK